MAVLKVTPTRSELSILKARLATSKRGHKLLEDKQDELMRRFIELIRKNKELRIKVEEDLAQSFRDFLQASSEMSPEMLESAVSFPLASLGVDIRTINVMSVNIPDMHFDTSGFSEDKIYPYGYLQTSAELDDAILRLNRVMDKLLQLAEVEKACQLLADEIESTRRRVNALEHRTIPDLEDTIKHITMKLDENERATIVRLMKTKEIIEKEELAQQQQKREAK